MKSLRLLLSVLGCGACVIVSSPAQHQNYDKATSPPPSPKGQAADSEGASDQPQEKRGATAPDDQLISAATRFKALDTDRDNRISRAEFTLASNLQLQAGAASGDSGNVPEGARPSQGIVAAGTTDSNFISGPGTRSFDLFDRIDTDKDGFISPVELAMHHGNSPPISK